MLVSTESMQHFPRLTFLLRPLDARFLTILTVPDIGCHWVFQRCCLSGTDIEMRSVGAPLAKGYSGAQRQVVIGQRKSVIPAALIVYPEWTLPVSHL